jgi:cell division protein FtsB
MVLLHTAWKFNGLAGALVLLTVIIVVSGFVGRYIYTAVPRTADGVELEAGELERQSQSVEAELKQWLAAQPESAGLLAGMLAESPQPAGAGPALVFERSLLDWKYRRQWQQAKRHLPAQARSQVAQLEALEIRKRTLTRQIESLAMARRMLGLWHSIHMPIGVVLFTVAFIHVGAVLYFVLYLR